MLSETRRLHSRLTVLYHGPEATTLADRWQGGTDRPFDLVGWNLEDRPREAPLPDGGTIDCAVVDGAADHDAGAAIERVRAYAGSVPVLAVATGPIADPSAIAPTGSDGQVTVPPGADRVRLLGNLADRIETLACGRRDRTLLSSLLSNIPLSAYVKDRAGRHVAVSDAMFDMFDPAYTENAEGKRHHHPADVLGKTDFDLYDADLAERTAGTERSIVETGDPVENRIERAADSMGPGTYVLTSKAPWYDHTGTARGIVGLTRDVTERKRYENRLQRQNDRLRGLTAMVSEGLEAPLSTAGDRLGAARETGERVHFDAVEGALERIESLVEDVLEITRQGQPVTEPDAVPLADAARSAYGRLGTEGMALSIETGATIRADAGRLQLLLEHLFANAGDHASGGDPSTGLTITVGDLPDGEGFYVEDDGVGIPLEDRESVFEPRRSTANTSGIGLNIVAAIADAHNWRIDVTESESGGARFEFRGVESGENAVEVE